MVDRIGLAQAPAAERDHGEADRAHVDARDGAGLGRLGGDRRPARAGRWRSGASTQVGGAAQLRAPSPRSARRPRRCRAPARRRRARRPRPARRRPAAAARRSARASPRAGAGRAPRRSGGRSTRAPRRALPGGAPEHAVHVGQQRRGGQPVAVRHLDDRARQLVGLLARPGMKAPEPTFTSITSASSPAASFLERIEATISGSDSTVPVASRIAYRRRSAGASCAGLADDRAAGARRPRAGSARGRGCCRSRGSSRACRACRRCGRARGPEIIGTAPPQAATIGASSRLTLSPTPPVECLSSAGPGRSTSDQSSTSPECVLWWVKRDRARRRSCPGAGSPSRARRPGRR